MTRCPPASRRPIASKRFGRAVAALPLVLALACATGGGVHTMTSPARSLCEGALVAPFTVTAPSAT